VYKISQIYLESLMRLKQGEKAEAPIIDKFKAEVPEEQLKHEQGKDYYRDVVQVFKPPQGTSQSLRAVNPDWVAGIVALASFFFLAQIYNNNRSVFWYMVLMVAVGYGLFFLFHNKIKAKFEKERSKELNTKQAAEKAVGKWMKLYYCTKDNVVFGAKKDESAPLEEFREYLTR
jgi:hypothetical protein